MSNIKKSTTLKNLLTLMSFKEFLFILNAKKMLSFFSKNRLLYINCFSTSKFVIGDMKF